MAVRLELREKGTVANRLVSDYMTQIENLRGQVKDGLLELLLGNISNEKRPAQRVGIPDKQQRSSVSQYAS